MTEAVFERIRDESMIHVRDDGAISCDSRLECMLDADALEMLLTICGDNIVTDPTLHPDSGAEVVDWSGVKDDWARLGGDGASGSR